MAGDRCCDRGSRSRRGGRRDPGAQRRTGVRTSHQFVALHARRDPDDDAEYASRLPGLATYQTGQPEDGDQRRAAHLSGTATRTDLGPSSDQTGHSRAYPARSAIQAGAGVRSLPRVRVAGRLHSDQLPRPVLQEWNQGLRDDRATAPRNPSNQLPLRGRPVPMGSVARPRLGSNRALRCAYSHVEVRGHHRVAVSTRWAG